MDDHDDSYRLTHGDDHVHPLKPHINPFNNPPSQGTEVVITQISVVFDGCIQLRRVLLHEIVDVLGTSEVHRLDGCLQRSYIGEAEVWNLSTENEEFTKGI